MAYRLPAHLHRNRHGTLYFRLSIPNDLRLAVGQGDIYRSLGTSSVRQAAVHAQTLRIAFGVALTEIRAIAMSNSKKTVQEAWKEFVDAPDLRLRLKVAGMKITLEDQQQQFDRQEVEIASLAERHERDLEIALRAKSGTTVAARGVPFGQAVAQYFSDNTRIKANSRQTYKSKLDHAQAHFGTDADIRHIGQAEFSSYARHVAKTIADPITAGNYITTVSGFLNWFRIREGWGDRLTTKTLIPKKDTPDTADRDAFTLDQIGALFKNAAQYRNLEPHKYWATLLPAFTGCRLEELAQLNLKTDLRRESESGVWYFDLNGRPDEDGVIRKSMKNLASWRVVPIHSALVAHGLIEYLNAQQTAGFGRPFEAGWNPRIYDDGKAYKWGHYVGKWGGRELLALEKAGTIERARLSYYHSQRHTFSRFMSDAKVSAEICEALLGHQYAGSERERYNKLKSNSGLLSRDGIEPGLAALARLLHGLR